MVLSVLEGLAWGLCTITSVLAIIGTLGQNFPAQSRALVGETMAGAIALILALLAARRTSQISDFSAMSGARAGWALAGVAARCLFCLPVYAIFLICAAAGFAA